MGFLLFACLVCQVCLLSKLLLLCVFVDIPLPFAFYFSFCKWKLFFRTADLNVLRQEDLSFSSVKLVEFSFMWWVFSSQFHCFCPSGINLSWSLWEEKDFYSSAVSRLLLSRPAKPVQWGYILIVLNCLMQNILRNSRGCVLHAGKAVIFHQWGCQAEMQVLFKAAISKRTFGENWLCLKADACCPVIATSLKYFSSNYYMPLSSLDTCHENSQM